MPLAAQVVGFRNSEDPRSLATRPRIGIVLYGVILARVVTGVVVEWVALGSIVFLACGLVAGRSGVSKCEVWLRGHLGSKMVSSSPWIDNGSVG